MDLISALRKGLVDPITGDFYEKGGSESGLSLLRALSSSRLTLPSASEDGMSLSDALRQGLLESSSGRLADRFSGRSIRISEAISRGLLNPGVSEVFDSESHLRITLEEALRKNIIDEIRGHFVLNADERMSLLEAYKKNYLCSPLTLKMCDDYGLLETGGTIRDPVLDKPVSILQGILSGFLDISLKSVKDCQSDTYVTLGEALQTAIITPNGEFCDIKTRANMSLTDAVKKGYLTTVSKKSIFDIEGIKDSLSGEYISFNAALQNGTIDKASGKVTEHKSNRRMSFLEASSAKDVIQPQLAEMLKRKIGIAKSSGGELSLVEAVFANRIDTNSGLMIDSGNVTVPMEFAIQKDLITPMGAAVLKSLLNITVTTATVTQTVRRSFKVSSNDSNQKAGEAISFQDALKQGLINEKNMIFTFPNSDKTLPLEEAINRGLIALNPATSSNSSKIIRSSFSSSSGGIGDSTRSSLISEERRGSSTFERRGDYTSIRKSSSSSNTRYIPITIVQENPGSKTTIPNNGYSMKEAIRLNLFDVSKGVFTKANRRISSATEVIKMKLIDPRSVKVSSPEGAFDLKKALDKKVMDDNWRLRDGKKYIPLKQALSEGKVSHCEPKESAESDVMVITPNVKFRKSSGKFEVGSKLAPSDLTNALKDGKIRPTDVRVQIPSAGGRTVNFAEAVQNGLIDKSTGEYLLGGGEKIPIIEGITKGYISILGSPDVDAFRYGQSAGTMRSGKIQARIVESGTTTTKIHSYTVTTSSGEEFSLEEALKRGLISQEMADKHKEQVSTDSKVNSVVLLIVDPETGEEISSEEAVSKGIVTEEEVKEFLSMKNSKPQRNGGSHMDKSTPSRKSSSSSSCSSSSTSSSDTTDDSYRSELTINIDSDSHKKSEKPRRRDLSPLKSFNVKPGYSLSSESNVVRHLATGESMSVTEAELKGITIDSTRYESKLYFNDAMDRGLLDLKRGIFSNPKDAKEIPISEALKSGELLSDFQKKEKSYFNKEARTITLLEAFQHCFDREKRIFYHERKNKYMTLVEAVASNWINKLDVIFDVSSNTQQTLDSALKKNVLDGKTCDITLKSTSHFFLDAAEKGLIAVFPEDISDLEFSDVSYSLKEAIERHIYDKETHLFNGLTLLRALKSGLVDYRSAAVKKSEDKSLHLLEAIEEDLIDTETCKVMDFKSKTYVSFAEAFKRDILLDIERDSSSTGFECISLWEAIRRKQLDTQTGNFYSVHEEKKTLTLEEAIFRRYIDKKSAYVKDTWKRKFMSLSEATRKKIIKEGRVMNTTTGKFLSIQEAIDLDILVRDIKLMSLIEILDFGMYQPYSGKVVIPGSEREMTLTEAVETKLIDITKTVVKSRKSHHYITIREAIRMGDIDGLTGMYGSINLLEARSKGYLLSRDALEAVQDKFRQAGSNLESLNKWLDKVERRIAGQESLSENVDNLKSQINDLKDIKEDIDNHNRPVNNTLDIIVELVETGSDVLSSAELNQLQSEGKVLKERYDSVNDNSDKLIKRQLSALEELLKFRSEMSSFSLWMEKAYKVLEDKERQLANLNKLQGNTDGFKEFISDVMTHGADLKFLTISGQKFVDLSKEYLNSLNEFKVKLRASHSKQTESQVSEEVTRVSEAYHELLTRANFLSDRFSRVGNKSKDYNDAVERAKKWLKDVEPRVSKMVSEPIGAEPRVVEEQLIRSRALNSEIIANEKFIIDAKQAAANLLGSLDDSQMSPQEKRAIEETPFELQDRYDALATAMANRCTDLDSALVQSQGVQDALANIVGWLDSADNSLKNMNKPASLIRERLDEQIRQMKVLQSDIDSHENSIQKMYQSAQEFVQSAKNVRESKKIESKVKEVQKKFDNLLKVVQQRNAHLSEVSVSLDGFTGSVEKFDDWYNEVLDVLESKEVLQMDSEEGMRRIEEVVRRKEQKKPEFDDMMKNGKGLVSKKDVTDTGPCKETLKELEEKWRELSEVLGERQNQNRARKQSLNAYESLRDQVNQWLSRMEQKIDQLDPVGVELDIIKKQMDEIRPLNQEYTSYSKTIDKINEIGIQYDAILRGSSSMENGGSNRRTSVTPRKPSLTPSILGSRRSSAVPKFSNGSIRRESQIPAFVDQSPIQIQLSEINNRYDMLGMRLGDRESDLSKMKEEIKIHLDNLKQIQSFLEKQEKNFPRDGTPVDKKESDKQLKVIKGILDQLYENQPLLDETKVAIKDVLRKRPDAPGAEVIDGKLGDVIARWKDLQDKCKSQIDSLDDLKDFQDIYDNLNNWLNSKGRMINVLGPIASDPRLVQNQMSQIAVMREEFNEKVPQKDRFNETADTLLDRTGSNTPDGRKINEKQGHINNKWDELLNRLDERERALEALSGPTRDFLNLSNKLQDNIAKVSDDLDDIAVSKEDPEQKMKLLEGVAKDFDDQRPLLAEVSSVGEHLMGILTDPASKSEIKGKLGQVERQYNNCRKKLDKALAELENAAREGREFDESCLSAEAMLREFESLLSDKLSVSADKDILKRQIKEFEPLYQEIMSKEHEIIMILNRGRDVISKSKNAKSQQKTLDNIDRQWQKLKKNAQDRQKRLNTSMEYCKKYVSSQDKFFPWLEKAEDTLHRLKPLSFVKSELQKQEKELTSFRNDVNRHSSEYEGTVVNGSTFVDSCDEDKEIVKDELSVLKERWDALNIAISERGQSLSDLLGKLSEFNEDARDLGNSLKRVEDKSASLANAPKDAKTLETIKGLLDDLQGLDKNLGKVQREGEDLLSEADHLGSDASNINDVMNNLGDRLGSLKDQLEEQADDLQNAGAAIGDFNEKIKELNGDIGQLDDEFNKFGPIARDLDTLNRQMNEVHDFMDKLGDYRTRVEEAVEASETIISQGFVSNSRELKDQVSSLNRTLDKLSNRGESREKDINIMIEKVSAFYDLYEGVMSDIEEVSREEKSFGVIGRDIESIKSQQEDFKRFQRNAVESVGKEVEKTNRNGQGLIQSAASGVNTNVMERDLEKLNDKWNDLKQSIADRERKLDQGLLQSGKFQEALAGLLSWMDEMDEMIANQKAPSSDYKVIKAQVQEQKFVAKLLADRKGAVDSLIKMGKEIASSADPSERRRIEGEVGALEDRFTDLTKKSQDRKDLLEDAMQIAKEYHDKLGPLEKWLDKTEKKVKAMEVVPTEEDQIQRRINEHDKLHEDILGKQPSFDDLADVASALMQVVGEEDAQALAEKIEELTNRYGLLVGNSDNIHKLLKDSIAGLRSLVLTYEDLLSWMETVEKKLGSYKILSVFSEKLLGQMEELHSVTEEIVSKQKDVDDVIVQGNVLMKNIANEEALQLKDKLDSLQRKYNDLASKAADLLKNAQEMLPLVQSFHQSHSRLTEWMTGVEGIFQSLESYSLEDQELEIKRLEQDVLDNRPLLESINISGPQLCQMSPGEGARSVEELVSRDNKRFDAICEQIQRRGERIQLSKQRSNEVVADIDELLDWFREVENQIRDADPPSSEPDVIRVQLKEHKALNDDISSQKGRVRDVLSNAKKVLRESAQTSETEQVKEKMDDLKETMEIVIKLSNDRLGILEQALPLSEHFYETHNELTDWLDDIEREAMNQHMPGMRPDQIAKQQEINRSLMQSIQDHKPVLDRLNKTGGALLRLIVEDDAYRVQEFIETDNQRYNALKLSVRERQQALEDALQECSQFTDKLDGMLNALANTAEQVNNAEPVSAHPEKIKEQMEDNNAIIDDLAKKEAAFEAVKKAANDIIQKAPNKNDPAIKDIKKKLDTLNGLWNQILKGTKDRSNSLENALALAEKFWEELQQVISSIKKIQDNLNAQDPPGVEPKAIEAQKAELNTIKRDIDNTKPGVDKCRQTGRDLIGVVGDVERPELKRHIEDLDNAWQNVTSMYARREQNLIDAMEKAMEFYETLRLLGEFLQKSEKRFDDLGPIGSDIDQVKKQIDQLRKFKDEVDPYMIKVEALNRQASDLTEKASAEQARAIKEPLTGVNHRWDDINKGISERQRELEHALLRLGQFQHALNELLIWIGRTEKTLDTLKPVFGDPQVIEVELAKLKVMVNDIQAHQSSVDTLNDAGRQIIESEMGSREASNTQTKLNELNTKWNNLLGKAEDRQVELEDALREAQLFNQEIQDMLLWLNDVDSALSSSKPVGGLPETAKDQLDRFMEVFKELEATAPKVEALLGRGHDYLKKSSDGTATNLQNNLKSLKSRWENIISRANDKKIKLEIALKEATEFHEALQAFINWLTQAEKTLSNLKPVSRVLETIKGQIEEHKDFQNEVSSQRETMLSLDKKGTHLKYFSQKQDVILIKNLLVSVQHRWEKVVSKSAERTRALDYGYKEAKEFHDSWEFMCGWLDTAAASLQDMGSSANKNDPIKIKKEIERHKDFQKELSAKQPVYDSTMKSGKTLKDKAPKTDENEIKTMLTELKNKWLAVCNLSVEKQRKLEEALLFSGQFKDALKALMDWLKSMEAGLDTKTPVHGDLDTVINLVEKHKNFEEELNARSDQVESLKKTAESLLDTADPDDASRIRAQITELTGKWESIWSLSKTKTKRLEEALKTAEELHKNVNLLLEWLTHAEMKLQFSGPLPEDEDEIRKQLEDHEAFMREMSEKERDKDFTIKLAGEILEKCHPDAVSVIKHWITIIQSRWDELASWSLQRRDKLDEHLKQLKDLLALLDELMQWLMGKENTLTQLEQEPLPDDVDVIKTLIDENQEFMDSLSARQTDIDSVCKPMRARTNAAPSSRRQSKVGKPGRDSRDQSPEHDPSRRPSRFSPDKENNLSSSSSTPANRLRKGSYMSDNSSPTRDYPKPWLDFLYEQSGYPSLSGSRRSSRVNAGDRGTPRFPDRRGSRASVGQEQSIKNPRAKALWEKWRHVWMMSWDRDRRLRDKLGYLQELEKVKNFNWDEWRKRFLKHHSNKKSRVTDLLRKLDTDVDGYLPRDEFIEGILKNKFPSSKLELSAVADKFDHGDGMIDWREFIAALRPDWEDRGPLTDTQRIDDEINRQVAQCTCRQKFKVFQVGEGKYRFGDSQKLRLVRILRSTVMVRVGGGWCALDEFLVKNDPCRAEDILQKIMPIFELIREKNRAMALEANDLFCYFPTCGVCTTSSPPKRHVLTYSPSSSTARIKEKSERSLPMPRGSIDAGSYSEEQMSFSNRRPSGIPGSRNGSRPPSRAGSNMSLNSDESPRGGSSVRRSSSMRSGGSTLAAGRSNVRNPVGFGSSSPRKSSVSSASYTNGRTASSSSTDRTPISGRSRTPSSSNIPVSTNLRTRTPSGSTSGLIQRSGSGIASGSSSDYGGRRTSKTTTSYGADGSRIKSTTTTTSFGDSQQQQRNW